MQHNEIFAFESIVTLKLWLRSFKVTGNDTIRQIICDFLLMFNSN